MGGKHDGQPVKPDAVELRSGLSLTPTAPFWYGGNIMKNNPYDFQIVFASTTADNPVWTRKQETSP
jgi:hypothetical protein